MPSAIVTVRELKNKETGIDISIPVHKEIKGLLQSTWEFYVVVVSNLPYFKSPKHKDSDVVQFMVPKKFADFEALHSKLNEKFPATILPALPRKTLITTENTVKERKSSLEKFLKFVSNTQKLATAFDFLEFLGVNSIKAGKFRTDVEGQDETTENSNTPEQTETEGEIGNVFEDVEVEEADLFTEDTQDEHPDMFIPTDTKAGDGETQLFDSPELGGGIDEGEEDLFFIPGSKEPSIITKSTTAATEDNSDILNIDDDLDTFLNIDDQQQKSDEMGSSEPEIVPKPDVASKPGVAPKPRVAPKPSIPSKPSVPGKPTPKPKPVVPKKPSETMSDNTPNTTNNNDSVKSESSMKTSDILQYIEANTETEDVDLFS